MFDLSLVPVISGSLVLMLRLLLISQREHYIPGRTTRVVWAWMRARPWVNIVLLGGCSVTAIELSETPWWSAVILGFCISFPVGFPAKQRNAWPRWTRRSRVLAVVFLGLALLTSTTAHFCGLRMEMSPLLLACTLLGTCEFALWVTSPMERMLSKRFLYDAMHKLHRVKPKVVGITGSWGKTSTKNHLRDLLASNFEVLASPASFNNQNGLSMTINEMLSDRTEVFIAEIGMYGEGEIASICSWLKPEVAVITAIGPMHIERVGSIEAIARAKSEILALAEVGVFWMGDPRVAAIAKSARLRRTVTCGMFGSNCNVEVSAGSDVNSYFVHGEKIGDLPAGQLHYENVACAVGAALALDVPMKVLRDGIKRMLPVGHRAEKVRAESGTQVIDDTFNSNPSGALRALEILKASASGRRVVVTPGFFELGRRQARETTDFVKACLDAGSEVIFVGYSNRRAVRALARANGQKLSIVPNRKHAKKLLAGLGDNDAILWENDLPVHLP